MEQNRGGENRLPQDLMPPRHPQLLLPPRPPPLIPKALKATK